MSIMLVWIMISLEAVVLSETLIISERADSNTESGGCLSSFTVPTMFYQLIKPY